MASFLIKVDDGIIFSQSITKITTISRTASNTFSFRVKSSGAPDIILSINFENPIYRYGELQSEESKEKAKEYAIERLKIAQNKFVNRYMSTAEFYDKREGILDISKLQVTITDMFCKFVDKLILEEKKENVKRK